MNKQYTRFFGGGRGKYSGRLSSLWGMILFISWWTDAQSQVPSWELEKERDGIQVYTRVIPNSSFKAFKGIVEIRCSLEDLVETLKDFPSFPSWYFRLSEGRILERVNTHRGYCYTIMDLPWPASDRDNIFMYEWEWPNEDEAILNSVSAPEYLDPVDGLVRIPESTSTWHLQRLGPERVRLVHEAHAHPGGELPAWLANSFVTEAPFASLKKLRDRIENRHVKK